MAGASDAGGNKMILEILGGLFGGLQVWDNRLEPRGTNPCKTLLLSKGLPWCT